MKAVGYTDGIMETKKCNQCGQIKPSIMYGKNRNYADGLHGKCIDCRRSWDREYYKRRCQSAEYRDKRNTQGRIWYQNNSEKRLAIQKRYRQNHKDKLCTDARDYHRNHVLRVNGRVIFGVNKRAYTDYCELTGRTDKQLTYHHWDNTDLSKGIWVVTWPSHKIADLVEQGHIPIEVCERIPLAKKYLELRQQIETASKYNEGS